MKYQELIKEVEGVGKLKLSEQEAFYRDVLNESSNDLEVRVAATFYLGMAYYYEGNFNKSKEIIEPIILQYQSMPFVRELISAFNLMGVMLCMMGQMFQVVTIMKKLYSLRWNMMMWGIIVMNTTTFPSRTQNRKSLKRL